MRSRLSTWVTAWLLLGASGCAVTRDPRRQLLETTSANAIYKLPPDALLDATRQLLAEQHYELLPSVDPLYVHTTWRIEGNLDSGASWSKVFVQVHPTSDGRAVVRAYRMTYTTNGRAMAHPSFGAGDRDSKLAQAPTGSYVLGEPLSPTRPIVRRAPDFEWEVLERVEPRFAAFLQTRAQHYLALGKDPSEPTEE
ncbi:hypothetical protein LXT21_10825 [Myxococcus sp. K38C18041901]|uniref:hypothetical protein n=1 Tax=Myxococcus guangdongensis TaxID=2906760 RepID=UPI0020A7134F|nr:hypothetical protein [Myxococcus guangdongensis]MCP3059267.1 hypothetical protein [Myxococcus guangdongensis]